MLTSTLSKVIEIIKTRFEPDFSPILAETKIVEDLLLDSLDIIELVMSVEEEFNLEFPDEEIENCKTVEDICNLIESK